MSNQEKNNHIADKRADIFSEVAKSISSNDWHQFARRYLLLLESEIDDIQTNFKGSFERKYQMICKWSNKEGINSTPERLCLLRNQYQGGESAPCTDLPTNSQSINTQPTLSAKGNVEEYLEVEETDGRSMSKVGSKLKTNITIPISQKQQKITKDICTSPGKNFKVEHSTPDFYEQNHANNRNYEVKSKPKGHALVLCNINFEKEFKSRRGAEDDCKLMRKLFEGLGLQVEVKKDLKMEEMWICLKSFAENKCHKQADMCVLVIMSHGDNVRGEGNVIYGIDLKPLCADKVIGLFNNDKSPNLINKPKMLFFQFCRGENADKGVSLDTTDSYHAVDNSRSIEADSFERIPTTSDVLVAWATQEGNLSFRFWFTNAIANVFSQHAYKEHVCDMLTMVKDGVAKRTAQTGDPKTHNCKAMPQVEENLRKKIYFFPGFP